MSWFEPTRPCRCREQSDVDPGLSQVQTPGPKLRPWDPQVTNPEGPYFQQKTAKGHGFEEFWGTFSPLCPPLVMSSTNSKCLKEKAACPPGMDEVSQSFHPRCPCLLSLACRSVCEVNYEVLISSVSCSWIPRKFSENGGFRIILLHRQVRSKGTSGRHFRVNLQVSTSMSQVSTPMLLARKIAANRKVSFAAWLCFCNTQKKPQIFVWTNSCFYEWS